MRTRLVALFLVATVSGCLSTPTLHYDIDVNSLARPDAPSKTTYVLLSGSKSASDLQFQEFAQLLDSVLAARGFRKVQSIDGAQVAILFAYGIDDGTTQQQIYSTPIYGQTGSRTVGGYTTPTFGVTSQNIATDSTTTFKRVVVLTAFEATQYKAGTQTPVWQTTVNSTGSSNDLRVVMPYMLKAAAPYLATDTKKAVKVMLKDEAGSK